MRTFSARFERPVMCGTDESKRLNDRSSDIMDRQVARLRLATAAFLCRAPRGETA